MANPKIVSIQKICSFYDVPISFFDDLAEYELIEIMNVDEQKFIKEDNVTKFEKILRLHYDLNVNMEGIDVITNLLNKIEDLQAENNRLKNILKFYE